jgi:hypothetical protein
LGKKIEKAIILRDGKPSFLLMEFSKYEKIMAEYEELKSKVESSHTDKKSNVKKAKPKNETNEVESQEQLKHELKEGAKKISFESGDYATKSVSQSKPLPKQNVEEEKKNNVQMNEKHYEEEKSEQDNDSEQIVEETEDKIDNSINKEETLTEEEEIQKAFRSVDAMNLDDDMKVQAKEKVRLKIIQARKERALLAQEQEKKIEEERELERQVEAEKNKKEQELEEFWD